MRILLYYLLFIAWLCSARPVWADQQLFEDNFNDNNFSDWTVQRNHQWSNPDKPCMESGQPAEWEIVDGELGITIDGAGCTTAITPDLDLTNTHSFTYEFDWHFQESMNMDRNVALLWQDKNNWYGVKVFGNEVRIEKVVDGRSYSVTPNWTNFTFSPEKIYHFELTVNATNTIVVKVDGQEILKAEDNIPFITGFKTVGLMASVGAVKRSVSYFDNVRVVSHDAEGIQLHVALIKQIDPAWKDVIYDTATSWSNKPTIGRWGCALTSAAMVLRYHGITRLPNNAPLTPGTLNGWLNSQPDGYVGEGALNWIAITRLTQQMSDTLHTPKLEYRWVGYDQSKIRSEIEQKKPVIIQIPGHFLVADGVTSDQKDFNIKDPAYLYDLLSKHSDQPTSARTFQPSYTDLSYIMIVHSPDVGVDVKNSAGNIPESLDTYSEFITDQTDKILSTKINTFTTIAKPTEDTYTISFLPTNSEPVNIKIFIYDTKGNVSVHPITVNSFSAYSLSYSSINQSTLIEVTDRWKVFKELLAQLYAQHEIPTHYVFKSLETTADWARNDQKNETRYLNLINKKILDYQQYMTQKAFDLLHNQLETSSVEFR